MTQPRKPAPNGDERELARARDLLTRTVEFLTHCMRDPKAALASDDPRELIRGLQALARVEPAVESEAPEKAKDSPPIQIRRRRSA